MRIFPNNSFIKNLDASILRENFLISSIATILIIRMFLKFTGYPAIGGSEFHIAHLLWGGFFMLAALLIIFSFLSKASLQIASVLAGIGFGAFIDELGKFITRDNDYFYQPTFAIIYAIFVLIYIAFRILENRKITDREYLINAIEMVEEAVINDLDNEEKKKALLYLQNSNKRDPLVIALYNFFTKIDAIQQPNPSFIIKYRHIIVGLYLKLARSKLLVRSIVVILFLQVATIIITTLFTEKGFLMSLTTAEKGRLITSGIAFVLTCSGIIYLILKRRFLAYRLLQAAILILLLLTQFFQFYDHPINACVGVVFNILLLLVVDYILEQEGLVSKKIK